MPIRYPIPPTLTFLAAALVAVFLCAALATPGLAAADSIQHRVGHVQHTAGRHPSPAFQSQQPTPSPVPEALDERPVERNPFLVAGGVLIFLVILFGVWKYSRPPVGEG
jgi:hypothetical protein